MKVGFIGLGNVGGKLANNLLENNFQIIVLDKNLPQNITLVVVSLVVATLIFLGVDVILRLNKKRVHLNVYSRAKKNIMMFRLIAISPQKSCNFSSWLLE